MVLSGIYSTPGSDAERLKFLDEAYEKGETFWDTGKLNTPFAPTFRTDTPQPTNTATAKTCWANGSPPTPPNATTSSWPPNSQSAKLQRTLVRKVFKSTPRRSTANRRLRSLSDVSVCRT